MEIWTLLKANIRHKRGSFISIIILMIIIFMALTAILSVNENCTYSVENAYDQSGAGDIVVGISKRRLTDELLHSIENHTMVDHVKTYRGIVSDKAEIVNGEEDTNSWFLLKQHDGIKLFNSDLTAYEDEIPMLGNGEIYITQGVKTNMKCDVGDMIRLTTIGGVYEFTIKGIIVEPVYGSAVIGWKQIYISDNDYTEMLAAVQKAETEEKTADVFIVNIFKKDDCKLTLGKLRRQLNLDTGIIDNSFGSLTRDMSVNYTLLFPDIITSIMTVFIGLLLVIVLIIMGHSISTGIEMDYVNLGVLKSQGFHKGRIQAVFILQYLLAEVVGAAIGTISSIPLIKKMGNVFQPITGILAENHIALTSSLLIFFAVFAVSGVFVFIITGKIGKISPVRAISGGRNEIYFDSRMKAPIHKRGLLAGLALRQFTSSKRRYTASIVIAAILVFFMMTITELGNTLSSKFAGEAMGGIMTEIDVSFKEEPDDKLLKDIEEVIEMYSPIQKKYYLNTMYLSIEGEETYCMIYKNPDVISILKGRVPLYDNEIVITEIIADEFQIGISDKVTISHNNEKGEYIVSGIFQCMNDTGRAFAMSLEGAKKLGVDNIIYAGYSLENWEKGKEIAAILNEEFSDLIEAKGDDDYDVGETYDIAVNAMKTVIYGFSVIFALVVVAMVCSKMFTQEKTDIGIYKAMGFTSGKLRMQFAIRFLIVAVLGSAIGALLSVLFSGRLLSGLLRSVGITNFVVDFTLFTFIAPIVLICVCFFVFAYFVSRRTKNVAIRELVTE